MEGSLSLGDGALELSHPASWRIEPAGRDSAKARFSTGDYPVLGISLVAVEDPAAVASGDVAPLLRGGDDGVEVEGDADSGWSVAYQAVLDGSEEVRVWRRAAALPPGHLRIATFALSFPATPEARSALGGVVGEIGAVAAGARFSDAPSAIDREASGKARAEAMRLEAATPWEGVSLRLPADWRRIPDEGERRLVLESAEAPGAYLVLEGDVRPLSSKPPGQERAVRMIQAVAEGKEAEGINILSAGEEEYLLSCHRRSDEGGTPVRERFWHRFLFAGGALVSLNATFVHPDGEADPSPELSDALANVLGREVRNAGLSAPA